MIRTLLSFAARSLTGPNRGLDKYLFARNNTNAVVVHCVAASPQILIYRKYAKGRDIKKDKKKKIQIDENELRELFDVEKLFGDLSKPLDYFKQELAEHASLRTSHGAIENIKIHYEGDTYRLQDLAEIGKKNPKLYVVDVSSFPQVIPVIVTTLQASELNLNVQQEGTRIFIPIPKVTKEHRENLVKKSKSYFVKCKTSVRDIQMRYIKKLKNIENLSEEMKFRVTDQLTALADKQIGFAEEILKEKQNELLKTD